MYRDYEEYMRVVWGYNPIMQDYNRSAYINPYTNQQFNNMQFEDFRLEEDNKSGKVEEFTNHLKDESVNYTLGQGNVRKNNTNVGSNSNEEKKQFGKSCYQCNHKNEKRSGPATSYKNFLKF